MLKRLVFRFFVVLGAVAVFLAVWNAIFHVMTISFRDYVRGIAVLGTNSVARSADAESLNRASCRWVSPATFGERLLGLR